MITSAIGKLFIEAYNEEYCTNYDARSFFLEKFYPLFFDHNKYMITGGNSPLENPKISWDDMIKGKQEYESPSKRKKRLGNLLSKIETNIADMSIARGYSSTDICATTSGQVTDFTLPLTTEDTYASWIGDALGIGVLGGFSILFMNKKILIDLFKGWILYRKLLNENRMLKGNQINAWNGQWLSLLYDNKLYNNENPLVGFNSFVNKGEIINLSTQSWTKILINISKKYSNSQLIGYVYSIGKTNISVGFISFDLKGIRRPIHLYNKLFGQTNSRNAESLWGTAIGFRTSCTAGTIGIKAMEPKGLKEYIENRKKTKSPKDENETININVYKIWILAMLNNDELWDKSQELAEILDSASTDNDKTVSTKRKNIVENLLNATNKKQFVIAATEVFDFVKNQKAFKDLVKVIHNMPSDNVPFNSTKVRLIQQERKGYSSNFCLSIPQRFD